MNSKQMQEIINGGPMRSLKRGLLFLALMLSSAAVMAYTGTYIPGNGINDTVDRKSTRLNSSH